MLQKIKSNLNKVMKTLNLRLVRANNYESLLRKLNTSENKNFIDSLLAKTNYKLIDSFDYPLKSSQLGQEIFVLATLGLKTEGYFVEVGAADGIFLSNTYVLERDFRWQGICVEPARIWKNSLQGNRFCNLDFRCVFSTTGKTSFKEASSPELSTIFDLQNVDAHAAHRKNGICYEVETVSLLDLLKQHNAPKKIDYISIDTEGSELEILENFDFSEYSVSIFTIEHNFTGNRERIYNLMSNHGYRRVLERYSQFDDWYVKEEVNVNQAM